MSGPDSALAYGSYARSRAREIGPCDPVLTHCNSYADGYWTDITRTFIAGGPDARQREMYDAIFSARLAALDAIRPGARGADVDRAAREELTNRGFGSAFKHATGHGVGFAAIDHNARPRLHPASDDRLESGMVFNVEPGLYFEGYGGMRHCDMIALTADGAELLTPFLQSMEEMVQ
jgi:Xaa-Pro dipeptidase